MANKRDTAPTIVPNNSRENPPSLKKSRLGKMRDETKSVKKQIESNFKPKVLITSRTLRGVRK